MRAQRHHTAHLPLSAKFFQLDNPGLSCSNLRIVLFPSSQLGFEQSARGDVQSRFCHLDFIYLIVGHREFW